MTVVEIIAAVRDEAESLPAFVRDVEALRLPEGVRLRMVFVEDSSRDDTRPLLRRLATANPDVGYYFLARGHGQGPAIVFGLSRSRADAQIMMDADGSHPVSVIPQLVAHFQAGARVVQCVRTSLRERRAWRDLGTAAFQRVSRWLTGVDVRQQNVYFRLVAADVAAELVSRPRLSRYLRIPLPRRPAGALRTVSFEARERQYGRSKYPLPRLLQLAADGTLSLLSPARLAAILGALLAGAALLGLADRLRLAGLPLAAALALGGRYAALGTRDVVGRMRAVECANVGRAP